MLRQHLRHRSDDFVRLHDERHPIELVINHQTARIFGLTMQPSLLARRRGDRNRRGALLRLLTARFGTSPTSRCDSAMSASL
jgi:hypothetical protein